MMKSGLWKKFRLLMKVLVRLRGYVQFKVLFLMILIRGQKFI